MVKVRGDRPGRSGAIGGAGRGGGLFRARFADEEEREEKTK
jgi:hypothetical protein